MPKSILILIVLVLFIIITTIFVLNVRLTHGKDGTTIASNIANFYIPTNSSLKVYLFDPKPKELEQKIITLAKQYPGTFGIYIKNLSTGQEISYNGDELFTSASLYKLSVMYTLYYLDSKGKLDIKDPLINKNLKSMIEVSSNEASLFLVNRYTSWKEITQLMHSIGMSKTSLTQNPTVSTPKDVGKLLELLAKEEAISSDASLSMLTLMAGQKRNDRIPVLLPEDAIIAHKTGELYDSRHDAGLIVGPNNNFVLVLMSKDSKDPESVKPIMQNLSKQIYDFFEYQWTHPPEIL